MEFGLSDEGRMLQDGLRRYLGDAYAGSGRDAALTSETGFAPDIWAGLAEMGVIGALFAEAEGGFGGTGADIALVFEELGRVGAVDPLIDTGLLGGGLLAAFDRTEMLERVIDGTLHVALAHGEPGRRFDPVRVATTATRDGDGWLLSGDKAVVVNAAAAGVVIVSARTAGAVADPKGISLFAATAADLSMRPYPMVGGGMAAEIRLDGMRVGADALLGPDGGAFEALTRVHARATLAICAEALGLMEAIRDLTGDYLRTRKQFGQSIGKFQVIQHRMADLLIEIEQVRSAVVNLAGNLDRPDRDRHVHATKNLTGEIARMVVEESIQLHGGIGMTQEYALAHFARRLSMVDQRFGDTLHHLERFIALTAA